MYKHAQQYKLMFIRSMQSVSCPQHGMTRTQPNIDWAGYNVCTNTIIGYTADGFYRFDDPTNSVKALKEGG